MTASNRCTPAMYSRDVFPRYSSTMYARAFAPLEHVFDMLNEFNRFVIAIAQAASWPCAGCDQMNRRVQDYAELPPFV